MNRIEVNVITGKQTTIPLTDKEIAELQNRPQPPPPPVLTTEQKLEAAGLTVAELKELFGLP
jgi:antitoxin component HigA of HigAB toxin-antitoxin module